MLQTLHTYGHARLQAGMRERHAHAWTSEATSQGTTRKGMQVLQSLDHTCRLLYTLILDIRDSATQMEPHWTVLCSA